MPETFLLRLTFSSSNSTEKSLQCPQKENILSHRKKILERIWRFQLTELNLELSDASSWLGPGYLLRREQHSRDAVCFLLQLSSGHALCLSGGDNLPLFIKIASARFLHWIFFSMRMNKYFVETCLRLYKHPYFTPLLPSSFSSIRWNYSCLWWLSNDYSGSITASTFISWHYTLINNFPLSLTYFIQWFIHIGVHPRIFSMFNGL